LFISFPPGKSRHFTLKQTTTTSNYTLSKSLSSCRWTLHDACTDCSVVK